MNRGFGARKNEVVAPAEPVFDPKVVAGRLKTWFPELDPNLIPKLVQYQDELIQHNKAIALVVPASIRNAEAVHIADSIHASRLIDKNMGGDSPLYDFGSGNGFPGLVFAALYPGKKVIFLERDTKKIDFCKRIALILNVSNVTFQVGGIEDLPAKSVTSAVTRSPVNLQKTLLQARKAISQGGRLFHVKSDGWANELAQVPSQLFSFWTPGLLGQYKIPETSVVMSVVQTEKTAD